MRPQGKTDAKGPWKNLHGQKPSGKMNKRLSHEVDALISMMDTRINRAITSAISDRAFPVIQNIVGNLPLSLNGVGMVIMVLGPCNQGL